MNISKVTQGKTRERMDVCCDLATSGLAPGWLTGRSSRCYTCCA